MPKGGFGNLIALPLQRGPRANENSVFVDHLFRPHRDQWAFLSSIRRLNSDDVDALLRDEISGRDVINIRQSACDDDETRDPWMRFPSGRSIAGIIKEPLPDRVSVILTNLIYVEKEGLPPSFISRLIRLAAFQNPGFYKAQAMRLSTFGKPRVISCAEDLPRQVALPRGLLEDVLKLFCAIVRGQETPPTPRGQETPPTPRIPGGESGGVIVEVIDCRYGGELLELGFHGQLRDDQKTAAETMATFDNGILCAPTAFGKTVIAAWLIAKRSVSTLILVHRRHLMDQWRGRLAQFLGLPPKEIGQIGGGKSARTGRLDVAMIQNLIRKGDVKNLIAEYGQVIVDECHHVPAFSFERVLRQAKAKYVAGLTATPMRKDGHHPILLMQCGPIRFDPQAVFTRSRRVRRKESGSGEPSYVVRREMVPRFTEFMIPVEWMGIGVQEIFTALANEEKRNEMIAADVAEALEERRFPLVLTERVDHVEILSKMLSDRLGSVFVLKGGMGKRQREAVAERIKTVPDNERAVIVATGRYIGEGFDDDRLDTLFLAMPISWRGTLQQYAGRLHRRPVNKKVIRVYDYVDACVPLLNRMYEKRLKAYKSMGYTIVPQANPDGTEGDMRFSAIERTAVEAVTAFERSRGWTVESVEDETWGFDLISRGPVAGRDGEAVETRYIEVKGRAGIGEIALTTNEYKTAQRLKEAYWLYVVFNCASAPEISPIQDPARLHWEPLTRIDCYRIGVERLIRHSVKGMGQ